MQLNGLTNWFLAHAALFWVLGALSLVMFIGTIVALPLMIIYLPERYLSAAENPVRQTAASMSTSRLIFIILRNAVGAVLIFAGLVMLVLPGQGLVTLLIGLSLVNLPGKRRLVRVLVQQPKILGFINRVRTAANRPPVAPPN